MIEKLKICLVGASGVGKSSLVGRYVHSIFSERYRTTIGVTIERKDVRRGNQVAQLVIWDMSGEDEFQSVQAAYLRGAAGYVLVIDGTRPETVRTALNLEERVRSMVGSVPFVIAVNKADLAETWLLGDALETLERRGWHLVRTSAKTGAGVEALFGDLVEAITSSRERAWI